VKELDARAGRVQVRTFLFGEDGKQAADAALCTAALAAGRFQYNEERRMIIDPVFPEEPLLILGGSGLDGALSELAARAGFSVTLAAEPDRFPQAIQNFRFGAASYILAASRSYYDDYACLQTLSGRTFRYAGCLGSARKSHLLFEELRHAGWTEEMLARLHAPVGLPIGALSPEELAVSIVAELIAVRRSAG
jgi:xanthine dehydrogenase accessory factor